MPRIPKFGINIVVKEMRKRFRPSAQSELTGLKRRIPKLPPLPPSRPKLSIPEPSPVKERRLKGFR